MTTPDGASESDELLLADLRRVALEVDPVPSLVMENAAAAFLTLELDARLAVLVADSLLDDSAATVRKSVAEPRLLSFEADEVCVELETTDEGDRRRLEGQIVGGRVERIVVEHDEGATEARPDDLGSFRVVDLPAGRIRLRWGDPGSGTFVSSWVLI